MKTRTWAICCAALGLCAAMSALLGVGGCIPGDGGPTRKAVPEGKPGLVKFSDDSAMLTYMKAQAQAVLDAQSSNNSRWDDGFGGPSILPVLGAPQMNAAAPGGAEAGGNATARVDYSTTNLQELGVDEADFVKNTADLAYVVSGNEIVIVRTQPKDQMAVLSRTVVTGYPTGLHLYENRLTVISHEGGFYGWGYDIGMPRPMIDLVALPPGYDPNQGPTTCVTVLDVTNPAAPTQKIQYEFDGTHVTTRQIDEVLHLVVGAYPQLPSPLTRDAIESSTVRTYIPDVRVNRPGVASDRVPAVTAEDSFRPLNPNGMTLTSIYSLDVTADEASFDSVMVAANTGLVYASAESLYLSDTEYSPEGYGRETTTVHKFRLSGRSVTYLASGRVDGRPINSFALGEYEDALRIATHSMDFGGWIVPVIDENGRVVERDTNTQAGSNVFVLGENKGELVVMGEIRGIEPDERMYAARFMGKRGFLVTFRQIDPFFTLDLSNPTNPRVAGELKVPGFSTYLHLLGENHVIGIGRDVDEETQARGGVKISLFNITDLNNPVEQAVATVGTASSYSDAEHDSRAFCFLQTSPTSLRLALPLDDYDYYSGSQQFSGLKLFTISADNGIQAAGQLASAPPPPAPQPPYYFIQVIQDSFRRGVFTGDHVLSITPNYVTAAPFASPTELERLPIYNPQTPPGYGWGGIGGGGWGIEGGVIAVVNPSP